MENSQGNKLKKNRLPKGMVNESRDYIKKLREVKIRPEFYYCLTDLPHHIRQSKHYLGFYTLYISGLLVYVDCNHVEVVNGVEIPKVTCKDSIIRGEVIVLKRLLADRVREHLVKNKANVKPIITFEEVEELGLIEDLKKKHEEARPGRNLWNPVVGEVKVFKVQEKRYVDTKIGKSPIYDIVDVESKEELSVWGYARLNNVFEPDGVYVVEYNGKNEMAGGLEAHSFWVTDVTADYAKGVKKGQK